MTYGNLYYDLKRKSSRFDRRKIEFKPFEFLSISDVAFNRGEKRLPQQSDQCIIKYVTIFKVH